MSQPQLPEGFTEKPDFRKLCEELVKRLQPFANFACDTEGGIPCMCANCLAQETITRAKEALK